MSERKREERIKCKLELEAEL